MKTYLSLIPISAKRHKQQNQMTIGCIAIAVFLVTALFSMVEMGIRMEVTRLQEKHRITFSDLIRSEQWQQLQPVAILLVILILLAGVFMIAGSINSNVVQRTKFFGMMRCIGMSKSQVRHFVKLEALNWCLVSIPIGIVSGIVFTWLGGLVLHFVVGEEFSNIPLGRISIPGVISGIVMGVVTVLLAANAPAKRTAKVSPAAAVSGTMENGQYSYDKIKHGVFHTETILGIQHAKSIRKNLLLLTGSFALGIILFLTFSVLTELVGYMMPQSVADADIEIISENGQNSLDEKLIEQLQKYDGIQNVYGRRSAFDLAAKINSSETYEDKIDLISYDDFDLAALKKDGILQRGSKLSKVYGNSNYVIATADKNSLWKIGDIIQVGNEELEIAGLLKFDLFSGDGLTNGKLTLITSKETFTRLTGIKNYSMIMLQTSKKMGEQDIENIKKLVEDTGTVIDKRDQKTSGTYMAFLIFVYGFLTIIALVTLLNIRNSISMSVSARVRQYGVMRAVGMDEKQLTRMIMSEALTYATSGTLVGGGIGMLLHRFLYDVLIEKHFPYTTWHLPIIPLLIILAFAFGAVFFSVCPAAKRMRNMTIVENISEP